MSWRESLLIRFGPGVLGGITFGDWVRAVYENNFDIDPRYWPRACVVTLGSLQNSLIRWIEERRFRRQVEATPIEPPLFVLGIWRSGTTHLHNLLSLDERFAFPNLYQVMYPHTFLSTEQAVTRLTGWMIPSRRPQDAMAISFQAASEDEMAMCVLSRCSTFWSWVFPRARHYERYLSFRGASAEDVAQWKTAMTWLFRKLTWKYRKPLVLKSPGHTCRIKLLLEMFPDARFVHIHRDPLAVFQSTRHLLDKVLKWWTLQQPDLSDADEHVLRLYREVYDGYFAQRDLIPRGRLAEIAFADLERDPIGQMRGVYETLGLGDFSVVEPRLRDYLATLATYRKNTFTELPDALRRRIYQACKRSFDEWGYALRPSIRSSASDV